MSTKVGTFGGVREAEVPQGEVLDWYDTDSNDVAAIYSEYTNRYYP